MSEKVLLAGCGDLGLRVAQLLLARDDEVWALRRHPPCEDRSGIRWIAGDLTSAQVCRDLPSGISQLVYLPTPDRRDASAYREIFVDGLRHTLDMLGPDTLQRALLVSSTAVYGEQEGGWVDEDTLPQPQGFNGAVLLEAEKWLGKCVAAPVVLRLAGLYGPGRMQLLERLRGGHVCVPRTKPHWANRIHVDDAAAAVAHLLQHACPAQLYLGADDTPLPLHVLYDHLAATIGAPTVAEGPAPAGVGSKRLSNARLRRTGWVPRWPDAREGYAALITASRARPPSR